MIELRPSSFQFSHGLKTILKIFEILTASNSANLIEIFSASFPYFIYRKRLFSIILWIFSDVK